MMIIISLMDTAPLVDKTVTTVTSTVALSAISDSGTTIPQPYVSTSAQLAQYTIQPPTLVHVLLMTHSTASSTSYSTVRPHSSTPKMKLSKDSSKEATPHTTSTALPLATIMSYTEVPTPTQSSSTTQHQSQIVDTGSTENANSSLLKDLYQVSQPHTPHGSSHTTVMELSTTTHQLS